MKIAKSQLRRIIRDQINTEGIVDIGKSLFKAVDIYTDATSESDDPLADDDEDDDELEESMKVTKRQLKRIIREERANLTELGIDRMSRSAPPAWSEDLADEIVESIYMLSTATGLDLEDPEILAAIGSALDSVKTEFAIP